MSCMMLGRTAVAVTARFLPARSQGARWSSPDRRDPLGVLRLDESRRNDRRRFQTSAHGHMTLLERFVNASRNGDIESDGGGKAIAVPNGVRGADRLHEDWCIV